MGSSSSKYLPTYSVGTSGQRIPDSNCDWGSKCICPNNEHSYSGEYLNNLRLAQKENTSTRNYLKAWFEKMEVEPGEEVESKYDDRVPTPADLRFFGGDESDEEPNHSDSFDLYYVGECENTTAGPEVSDGQCSVSSPNVKEDEIKKKPPKGVDDA
ncbi:uncharacterized protein [Spinacia oleracea]|uniref:Uncharacterized protein LOC110785384 n=1 Tax=Spinacia oleracea TaxID=3562 RepID=A0A9R0IIQ5_SPIOL|nr:uncharacterized protein LOC110785384 [Spinacia oleracea]XP_021859522.1 uncharacterized protein LOC110798642 [Spinacia oleracea]XP_056683303.1 uncharacterized protein LOC130459776 [Spinacia oleracea]XP_056686219.1 uncharacterized protein LOC110796015 [Spinacia oleracea]XP_056686234.1 uncharacterized protein LOC130461946 [Spinacia oleracea]XP_056687290.1 uncharacterized protein LOC130462625 [Spinacia oleracea]XP_056689143.1 uncharacterized protein LOC130463883 [Spinacia oleracea]XP_05668953